VAKDKMPDVDPLAVIEGLSVDAIEAQIAAVAAEVEEFMAGKNKRLAALRALLNVAVIARDGPPPPVKRPGRAPGSKNKPKAAVEVNVLRPAESVRAQSTDPAAGFVPPRPVEKFAARPTANQRSEVAVNIHAYLTRVGAATPRDIAGTIGYSVAVVETTLVSDVRFEKRSGGNWSLRRDEEE